MISIVLYGRNDNYGYNLHKRAALSLNCMAEVLTDPSDEILFVDYNTPDDFPTFPEAIQDTLTKRARELLRILRVRPRIHERFKSKTHLVALEPVARNVAIRRSEPSNRWILSTNTDMIFVPQCPGSLLEIASELAPGFYHAPRIEIPEVLWESLDRGAPAEVINTVREWGTVLHLNEIILGGDYIIYDGPGDFQLLLRSDLFENQGFHEGMLLGWHVDSNMAKRMYVKYGTVGDLGSKVYGYHCDHTRQVTPAHSHTRLQNDWRIFCEEVERPDIPELADTWGCANDAIEEVRLVANPASVYVQALRESVGPPLAKSQIAKYTHETYNKISYDPRHMVPFLADMFASMPRGSNLAWYGAGLEMLERFAAVWEKLGFTGKILTDRELVQQKGLSEAVRLDSTTVILDAADAFVFDFGGLPGSSRDGQASKQLSDALRRRFRLAVSAERFRLQAGLPPRRVIALNVINNQYEKFVAGFVAAAATPCATHMRHGYVLPPAKTTKELLPHLNIGQAGIRVGNQIKSDPRKLGAITYGPYEYLDEGRYRLSIKIELSAEDLHRPENEPCIVIEIRIGSRFLGAHLIRRETLRNPDQEFFFVVSPAAAEALDGVDIRINLLSPLLLSIRSVTIESAPAGSTDADRSMSDSIPVALQIRDWLPYLSIGPLGCAKEVGVIAERGRSGYVVYGPHWPLPAGRYEMTAEIEAMSETVSNEHLIKADVTAVGGERSLVSAKFALGMLPRCNERLRLLRLPFELRDRDSEQQLIETRIWSLGRERFWIRTLSVIPAEGRSQDDHYPFPFLGEVGSRSRRELQNVDKRIGFATYSQAIELVPGHYRLAFQVTIEPHNEASPPKGQSVLALVRHGFDVLALTALTFEANQNVEHELLFDVPDSALAEGIIDFTLQGVAPVTIALRKWILEPAATAVRQGCDVCRVDNWLPFLLTSPRAYTDQDGMTVNEGREHIVVYGPFWSLPPGRYEMIASIVPHSSSRERKSEITGEIAADGGARSFAAGKWRLGQFQCDDAYEAVEVRLPFTLAEDLPATSRIIETRIFSPENAKFRIRSLAVRVRSEEPERNWFPYLTVGECGIHTGHEIKSIVDKLGCIAATPPMTIAPGHYKSFADIASVGADLGKKDCITLEAWSGSELIAIENGTPGNKQPFEFDVTEEVSRRGIDLRIRAIAPSAVLIRGLLVEKTSDIVALSLVPAALKLENWLPFLQTNLSAHLDQDGITVSEGREEFAVYGPFWTLPVGSYELIASIVPHPSSRDSKPIITGEVAADGGTHLYAADKWRLGQYQFADAEAPAEFRLPFRLADDLPVASRMIETRIFSPGNAVFRVRSLAVRASSDKAQQNWFPYLAAGECGIHTGRAIESIKEKGSIAATPPMTIAPGHYKLFVSIGANGAVLRLMNCISLEVCSGLDLIATKTCKPGKVQALEFDVMPEFAERGVEFRIRAIAPAAFSICGLGLDKISDAISPNPVPALLGVQDWLPFLQAGTAGRRIGQYVVTERGQDGYVVLGPNWRLGSGHYELCATIVRERTSLASAGTWTGYHKIKAALASIAQSLPGGGAEVIVNGRQVAVVEGLFIGPPFSRRSSVWLPFEITDAAAKLGSRVETRVWSNGRAGFRIRSLIVRRKTAQNRRHKRLDWSRVYSTAALIFRRIQASEQKPR